MNFTNATYMREKKVEEYIKETLSLSAVIDENDDVDSCLALLRVKVKRELGISVDDTAPKKLAAAAPTKPAAPKAPAKPAAPRKPAAPKAKPNIPYNREDKAHKSMFVAEVLAAWNPNWKADAPAESKEASVSMEGVEFLDSKGNILDSFKTAVAEKIDAALGSKEDDI